MGDEFVELNVRPQARGPNFGVNAIRLKHRLDDMSIELTEATPRFGGRQT